MPQGRVPTLLSHAIVDQVVIGRSTGWLTAMVRPQESTYLGGIFFFFFFSLLISHDIPPVS